MKRNVYTTEMWRVFPIALKVDKIDTVIGG